MSEETLSSILNTINNGNVEYSKEDMQILKFLEMVDKNRDVSSVEKPTPLHISTRSAKCKLTKKINMDKASIIIKNIIEKGLSDTIVGIEYKDISVGQIKKRKNENKTTKKTIKKTTKKSETNNNKNNKNNINKNGTEEKSQGRKKFYNQATIIIKPFKDGKNINVKFFLNGSISMTGCKNEDDGIMVIKNFINEMKKYPEIFDDKEHCENLDVLEYKITLINTDYKIGFKIDRTKLYKLLVENYKLYAVYDSSSYQGVKIGYMWNENNPYKDGICKCPRKCRLDKNMRKKNTCKLVTIAVFQSGNIIITGAYDIKQTMEAYEFINKILYDNYSLIVRFSILDCNVDDNDSDYELD